MRGWKHPRHSRNSRSGTAQGSARVTHAGLLTLLGMTAICWPDTLLPAASNFVPNASTAESLRLASQGSR